MATTYKQQTALLSSGPAQSISAFHSIPRPPLQFNCRSTKPQACTATAIISLPARRASASAWLVCDSLNPSPAMAATMTSAFMAAVVAPSLAVAASSPRRSVSKVTVRKIKNFGGLKPESQVTRMGMAQTTEKAFANVRSRWSGKASRGGALAANCDVASEIFKVVPIMSALTLAGIAIGFVLLRVEAAVEESE